MKVIIIEKETFDAKGNLISQKGRTFYPADMEELSNIPIGYNAEKIKLEVEFDCEDIPSLLKFLQNSQPCFKLEIG
jgi:hypothetical protein